jgi:hypothetical protein
MTADRFYVGAVFTVDDLLKVDCENIIIVAEIRNLSINKINTIISNAVDVVIYRNAPDDVNYHLSKDQYLAKFGAEEDTIK